MKKMKRDHLLWGVIILILGSVIYFGVERYVSIQKKESLKESLKEAEKEAELKQTQTTAYNLEVSKLFGIKLGDSAIRLISGLNNLEPTDEEYLNWFEPSGLLKGTNSDFLNLGEFVLKLNDFISGETLDWLVLYQNKDFEDYYIKYQPYGDYKITSIIGSLKKGTINYGDCVKALRPYATVIAERIKKENPDKHIIIEDNFFPEIEGEPNSAQIVFKYKKKKSYLDGTWILSLKPYCRDYKPYIELAASRLKIKLKTYRQIWKKINEQKELDYKKEFDDKANESKINKSGL